MDSCSAAGVRPGSQCVLLTAMFAACSTLVQANDTYWNQPSGGSWCTPENWSSGAIPGTNDNTIFTQANHQHVLLNESTLCKSLNVLRGSTEFNLQGHTHQTVLNSNSLFISDQTAQGGLLAVYNGVMIVNGVDAAVTTGSTGSLHVGPNATLRSTWGPQFVIGRRGYGMLETSGGGKVEAQLHIQLGLLGGSRGDAIIRDPGSRWDIQFDLFAGQQGDSSVHILDGAAVSARNIFIGGGSQSHSDMTIAGRDATATTVFKLSLGTTPSSSGALTIADGGYARTLWGVLAEMQNSSATAHVTGEDSLWHVDDIMYVGFRGHGSLMVDDAGWIDSSYGRVGHHAGSNGHVMILGELAGWTNQNSLHIGSTNGGTGTLDLVERPYLQSGSVIIQSNGTLRGNGTVETPLLTNHGLLKPGMYNIAWTHDRYLEIDGSLTQSESGEMSFELDALTVSQDMPKLVVRGTLSLNGTLRLTMVPGFVPPIDSIYTLIVADDVVGNFTNIELPDVSHSNVSWRIWIDGGFIRAQLSQHFDHVPGHDRGAVLESIIERSPHQPALNPAQGDKKVRSRGS